MSRVESNTTASRNGHSIESQICDFLGIPHDPNAIVDAYLDDKPLEIKSCQIVIGDNSHPNGIRSGRFKFNQEQHMYLTENDGIYALVVHRDGEFEHTRLIKASLITGISGRSCGKTWRGVMAGV